MKFYDYLLWYYLYLFLVFNQSINQELLLIILKTSSVTQFSDNDSLMFLLQWSTQCLVFMTLCSLLIWLLPGLLYTGRIDNKYFC